MNPEPANPSPAAPLVELAGATVPCWHDPGRTRLEQVDWVIREGDFWVVGGPPDSGKSDLLATAAGLLRPLQGTQRIGGRDTAGTHGDELLPERLRIGFVFAEGGRIFPGLTVAENVALPWRYHHEEPAESAAERTGRLLGVTGLEFLAEYPAGRISRVWRQRTALARALILDPAILFLDHPLGGLSHSQARWWIEFLSALALGQAGWPDRPVTLVLSTDDLRPWRRIGRQFGILQARRWRVVGDATRLAQDPDPLVRDLLAEPDPTP